MRCGYVTASGTIRFYFASKGRPEEWSPLLIIAAFFNLSIAMQCFNIHKKVVKYKVINLSAYIYFKYK